MKPVSLPDNAVQFKMRRASSATFYQEGMTQAEFLEFINANQGEWYLAYEGNKTKRPAQAWARIEGLEIAVVDKAPGIKVTSPDKRWDIYVQAVKELDLDTFFASGGEDEVEKDDEDENGGEAPPENPAPTAPQPPDAPVEYAPAPPAPPAPAAPPVNQLQF